jgi:hypothetical protein
MAKKILMISDTSYKPVKMFLAQSYKLAKGFIRLGHDAQLFSYNSIIGQLSPFKSKKLSKHFYKSKADGVMANFAKNYKPDIVLVAFPRYFDSASINKLREVAPNATYIVEDGDPWPKLNPGRIETAKHFDILTATNDGQWLQDYRNAGVGFCVFMPNFCDPDLDYRYDVSDDWRSNILWTGKAKHSADTSETFREELVSKLAQRDNCALYGCFGRPQIGGIDYLYAISGAKIGVNVNAYGPVKFCHSDRLIQYLAGGTFVMAKRFDDCDLLYQDNVHLRYFDTIEEFFDLADWYLKHEEERKKIADAGMQWAHEQFNCVKIAGYILEVAGKGSYSSPWFRYLSTVKI